MERTLHFQMSGRLVLGFGSTAELPALLGRIGCRRPLLVTDAGLVKAGLVERVRTVLSGAGVEHAVYYRVEPDPRIGTALDCAAALRASEADALIGLGGGSSLDVAKVAAILRTNNGAIQDYVGVDKIPVSGLPTILMPTTAGTGSEVTPIAVLSDQAAHLKKGLVSDRLYATVALVDPELTLGLPAQVTAYTGLDALTHAIEAYTNRFAQPFIDTFALEAIRLIGRYLRAAVQDGRNREARYHMALGSLYGGLCLGSVNTAAVHALAYPLGGTFNVPHGMANALLLPYVMRFNQAVCAERYAKVAEALGETTDGRTASQGAAAAVRAVVRLAKDNGIVSRMRDLNVPENAIGGMAASALQVTRLLNNNPRTVTLDDARRIYQEAW